MIHPDAVNDVVKFVSNVVKAVGFDKVVEEMDTIGWRVTSGKSFDPVELIKDYLASHNDNEVNPDEALDIVYTDFTNIAHSYAFEVNDDLTLMDVIPR